MFALYEFDTSSAAYASPAVTWLQSELHVETMVCALRSIMEQQHSLRTQYHYTCEGIPTQRVMSLEEYAMPIRNDSLVDGTKAEHLLHCDLAEPFDLYHGVLRVLLMHAGQQEHAVLINVHHIAIDGVSHELLHVLLFQTYQSLVQGNVVQLEMPAVNMQTMQSGNDSGLGPNRS